MLKLALFVTFTSFFSWSFSQQVNQTIDSLIYAGDEASKRGDNLVAEQILREALNLSLRANSYENILECYNLIGHTFLNRSDYLLALKNYYHVLRLAEYRNDQNGIALAYNGIGNVFSYQGELDEALEYYQKSLELRIQEKDFEGVASSYNGIGVAYIRQQNYELSKQYFLQSLEIKDSINDLEGQAATNKNLGSIYYQQNDFTTALEYYNRSLNLERKLDQKKGLVSSYFNIGITYFSLTKNTLALSYIDSSLTLAKRVGYKKGEMQAYQALSEIHQSMENDAEALQHYITYSALKDSISSQKKTNAINNIQMAYDLDKKKQTNQLLEKEVELSNLKLKRTYYIIFALGVIILLITITVFLVLRNRQLRTERKLLNLDHQVLRSQINPHFIFNSLNSIQNFFLNHQEKVANQYLTDFGHLMRLILENSSKTRIPLQEEIDFIQHYLSLEQARLKDKFTYEVQCEDIDKVNTLIPALILQPFVENSVWHGIQPKEGAGHIAIHFEKKGEFLYCRIRDNGIGVSTSMEKKKDQRRSRESKGVNITRERLNLLHSNSVMEEIVKIEDIRTEGKVCGTLVQFIIPLNP